VGFASAAEEFLDAEEYLRDLLGMAAGEVREFRAVGDVIRLKSLRADGGSLLEEVVELGPLREVP
jgi:hypothetical protein